jgi:hypothetical protein
VAQRSRELTDSSARNARRADRYGLLIALMSLVVAAVAVWVSWWVPVSLDRDAKARERTRSCIEAVVDLRAAMQQLSTGYAVGPHELAGRLADWDRGENTIERVRITCRDIAMPTARGVDAMSGLWQQVHTAHQTAAQGGADLATVGRVLQWTTAGIRDLTA